MRAQHCQSRSRICSIVSQVVDNVCKHSRIAVDEDGAINLGALQIPPPAQERREVRVGHFHSVSREVANRDPPTLNNMGSSSCVASRWITALRQVFSFSNISLLSPRITAPPRPMSSPPHAISESSPKRMIQTHLSSLQPYHVVASQDQGTQDRVSIAGHDQLNKKEALEHKEEGKCQIEGRSDRGKE